MSWRTVAVTDCKLTPVELATINNILGSTTGLQTRLNDTVAEFIGAMTAAGYGVNTDGTVPDQLRGHITARATWLFLQDFAQLKSMMTDGRKELAAKAETMLENVAKRKAGAIEDPSGAAPSNQNWNSNNKVIMRTQPTPVPSQQATPSTSSTQQYANPDAPADD
jgi:hypothetical protein